MTNSRALDTLTAADFRAARGEKLRISSASQDSAAAAPFALEIADVTEHPPGHSDAFRTPFSVLFHGCLDPVLPQGTYRLEHERLGGLDLFIVPVGPEVPASGAQPTAMRYEAVFG